MSNIVTYDSRGQSHFVPPSRERSVIRRFADSVSGGLATEAVRKSEDAFGAVYVSAFLSAVRQTGEAGVIGGLLGGLKAAGMEEIAGVRTDVGAAAAGNVLGVIMARSEFGQTLRTMGSTSMGVFAARQVEQWFGGAKSSMHGEDDGSGFMVDTTPTYDDDMGEDDPIIAAARAL